MYWEQGWENVPTVVEMCAKSWEHYNPDWEIRKLDSKSLNNYLKLENIKFPNALAAKSDIIRINLISSYGGVWVDATVWCNKPLDQWLKGTFLFSNPAPDRMIASWFIASKPDSEIVNKWTEKTNQYWSINDTVKEYFWFHYLFNELYTVDESFKRSWDSVEKIDCPINDQRGPHYFAPYTTFQLIGITEKFKQYVDSKESPVFKLSHHHNLENYDRIKYLFSTINKKQ
jgi:hypothetical protein